MAIKSATQRTIAAINEGLLVGNLTSFAACIGLSVEALYRALSALVKSGELVKIGRGYYALNTNNLEKKRPSARANSKVEYFTGVKHYL